MKKVFAFLAIFCLCFSMIGTASAVNYGGSDLPDINTVWKDKDAYPYAVIISPSGYPTRLFLLKYEPYVTDGNMLAVRTNHKVPTYTVSGSSWASSSTMDLSPNITSIDNAIWTSYDLKKNDGTIILSAPSMSCDGSSCPATDVNFDDYCDDCGGLLTYNLRVTPDTFNIIVKHSDSLTLKYSYTETLDGTTFNSTHSNGRITVTFDNPVNHYQYKLVDGDWELSASYPNTYGSHVISLSNGASVLTSDVNIYNEDGTLFFQNPLWVTVEAVTQGEMSGLTRMTVGTMMTLTVFGVGCLVLLIGFLLLPKVLRRFLG